MGATIRSVIKAGRMLTKAELAWINNVLARTSKVGSQFFFPFIRFSHLGNVVKHSEKIEGRTYKRIHGGCTTVVVPCKHSRGVLGLVVFLFHRFTTPGGGKVEEWTNGQKNYEPTFIRLGHSRCKMPRTRLGTCRD